MANTYKTITETATSEFKDRGSKFLAFAFPFNKVEQLKYIIKDLKGKHPKAIHFCYAYRVGMDSNQFRSNDDGEPSGSAGKPILSQIDSLDLTNVLVVVIRYWGGVLLGVSGLINAYKTACYEALNKLKIEEKDILILYSLQFNYTILNEIMHIIKKFNCTIISKDEGLFCVYTIGVPIILKESMHLKLLEYYELQFNEIK